MEQQRLVVAAAQSVISLAMVVWRMQGLWAQLQQELLFQKHPVPLAWDRCPKSTVRGQHLCRNCSFCRQVAALACR